MASPEVGHLEDFSADELIAEQLVANSPPPLKRARYEWPSLRNSGGSDGGELFIFDFGTNHDENDSTESDEEINNETLRLRSVAVEKSVPIKEQETENEMHFKFPVVPLDHESDNESIDTNENEPNIQEIIEPKNTLNKAESGSEFEDEEFSEESSEEDLSDVLPTYESQKVRTQPPRNASITSKIREIFPNERNGQRITRSQQSQNLHTYRPTRSSKRRSLPTKILAKRRRKEPEQPRRKSAPTEPSSYVDTSSSEDDYDERSSDFEEEEWLDNDELKKIKLPIHKLGEYLKKAGVRSSEVNFSVQLTIGSQVIQDEKVFSSVEEAQEHAARKALERVHRIAHKMKYPTPGDLGIDKEDTIQSLSSDSNGVVVHIPKAAHFDSLVPDAAYRLR